MKRIHPAAYNDSVSPYRTAATIPEEPKEPTEQKKAPMKTNSKIAITSMMIGIAFAAMLLVYGFYYAGMSQALAVVSPIAMCIMLIATLISCANIFSDK